MLQRHKQCVLLFIYKCDFLNFTLTSLRASHVICLLQLCGTLSPLCVISNLVKLPVLLSLNCCINLAPFFKHWTYIKQFSWVFFFWCKTVHMVHKMLTGWQESNGWFHDMTRRDIWTVLCQFYGTSGQQGGGGGVWGGQIKKLVNILRLLVGVWVKAPYVCLFVRLWGR